MKKRTPPRKQVRATNANNPLFATLGRHTDDINVRISYRIIQLFSEGLYKSPTKAIEELVANSFDAGATHVHALTSPDLSAPDSSIVVIDDGESMDKKTLAEHWLIGESRKRDAGFRSPKKRKQIGRFGIGKLATYVLANRLTHICKIGTKFYSASMNYRLIPSGTSGGVTTDELVKLPLLELTEAEARKALGPWTGGQSQGHKALKLFGTGAPKKWTVAILSDLKEMAGQLRLGRLKWVLATGMPLRTDFQLFLNGGPIEPEKLKNVKIASWIIGKDIVIVPRPAPADDLQVTKDLAEPKNAVGYFGLTHPQLGRITGSVDLYEDLLTAGKETIGRSHGFFVYVRGRLINADDEYFGIDSNKLRHGTFSRFRCEVHIDRLDEELRSSRESVRETSLLTVAQNILEGFFNVARSKHESFEEETRPGVQTTKRVAATPYSLTRAPILALVERTLKGETKPLLTAVPESLNSAARAALLKAVYERASSTEGLVPNVELTPLSQRTCIASYDAQTGSLRINTLHPFVAHFLDEYEDKRRNLPLELLAVSEVLLESRLYELGLDEATIHDLITQRDELLRYLARSTGKRNALLVSQDLEEAATNKDTLEQELVVAFDSMGFDAIPLGGKGRADGLAECSLSATKNGPRSYKVSLEAKSKRELGAKVTAKSVGVSTIARQRNHLDCQHAVVVGPDFPTTHGEASALVREIKDDRAKNGKTITLVRVGDMAKLVRLVPAKRIGLDRIRELFQTCITPEESAAWIDHIAQEAVVRQPYREILEAIAAEQKAMQEETVKYSNIQTRLRMEKQIRLAESELVELCRALSRMAPEYVFARLRTVEISTRPDKIVEAIGSTIRQYPAEEKIPSITREKIPN
jgi:hypothetical protein